MSEKKEPENKERKARKIFDILQENGAMDNYIELFYKASQETETPMTEEHKAVMRNYAKGMADQWDIVLEKIEDSLQNPNARKEFEKSVRQLNRIKNPQKKTE